MLEACNEMITQGVDLCDVLEDSECIEELVEHLTDFAHKKIREGHCKLHVKGSDMIVSFIHDGDTDYYVLGLVCSAYDDIQRDCPKCDPIEHNFTVWSENKLLTTALKSDKKNFQDLVSESNGVCSLLKNSETSLNKKYISGLKNFLERNAYKCASKGVCYRNAKGRKIPVYFKSTGILEHYVAGVVNETFIIIQNNCDKYDPIKSSFLTWALNRMFDVVKKESDKTNRQIIRESLESDRNAQDDENNDLDGLVGSYSSSSTENSEVDELEKDKNIIEAKIFMNEILEKCIQVNNVSVVARLRFIYDGKTSEFVDDICSRAKPFPLLFPEKQGQFPFSIEYQDYDIAIEEFNSFGDSMKNNLINKCGDLDSNLCKIRSYSNNKECIDLINNQMISTANNRKIGLEKKLMKCVRKMHPGERLSDIYYS
jgi:hypothetical protein